MGKLVFSIRNCSYLNLAEKAPILVSLSTIIFLNSKCLKENNIYFLFYGICGILHQLVKVMYFYIFLLLTN